MTKVGRGFCLIFIHTPKFHWTQKLLGTFRLPVFLYNCTRSYRIQVEELYWPTDARLEYLNKLKTGPITVAGMKHALRFLAEKSVFYLLTKRPALKIMRASFVFDDNSVTYRSRQSVDMMALCSGEKRKVWSLCKATDSQKYI